MEVEKINEMTNLKCDDGVIAITKEGEVLVSRRNKINARHWCCLDEIEGYLNLNSNAGTEQMEHAWFLAKNGIISLQIVKDLVYIIVSPEVDMLEPAQLQRFYEVIETNFSNVGMFGVDLVSEDGKHKSIEIDNQFEYGIKQIYQIFTPNSSVNHKRR